MAKRRRRRNSLSFGAIFIVLVALAIIGYVVYLMIGNLTQQTALIESGSLGNQYVAQAVIVRNETITDAEGLTRVNYFASEGETLQKGMRIAEVYASGTSQSDMSKLLNVRSDIKERINAILAGDYIDNQLSTIDDQIKSYARELGVLIQGGRSGNLINLEKQLSAALTRRQSYLQSKYSSKEPALKKLYDDEVSLAKKMQNWAKTSLAEEECIISFYTDGYETMLQSTPFDEISVHTVKSILAGEEPQMTSAQRGRTTVFRQVQPHGYSLLLLSNDKNWNPVEGEPYKVQLKGFEGLVIDATVSTIFRSGTEILVRMHTNGDVSAVLNVRTADADVGEMYVSGLKVPLNALRQQGEYTGVVVTDQGGYFVPVSVITQNNSFAVIQPLAVGALWEGQRIKLF